LTAVATDAAGISATSAPVTLTVSPPVSYGSWQNRYFTPAQLANSGTSGDLASPAGDGIPNLLKYALNLSPWEAGTGALPAAGIFNAGGISYLSLTYNALIGGSDITYIVEVSGDLQTWNAGPGYTTLVGQRNNADGVTESVTVSDLVPLGSASKRFIRLRVTKP
jgi:hypothetical protein